MDALEREFAQRKDEIKKSVRLLFHANMKFTDWDIPEVDDTQAATMLLAIMQEALDEIAQEVKAGKYDNY